MFNAPGKPQRLGEKLAISRISPSLATLNPKPYFKHLVVQGSGGSGFTVQDLRARFRMV